MNRETWLNQLAELMAPRFEEMGKPIPKFRVAVGWTSAGKTSKVGGECWHSNNSADNVFEILCAPIVDDSMEVAAILAHELSHAAAGFKHGHKGDFAKLMAALGLSRPFTSSIAGPRFKEWVQPFLDKLGNIPHARIMLKPERTPREVAEDAGDEGVDEDEGGSSNQKKKQTTRMLKATCDKEVDGQPCGYTVRLSKKWAQQLGACCPEHGAMEVEGADDAPGDDDADA
ncbi:transcription elongation protein SprT [Bradyrhizobium sp. BWC-3-1]|uniref:transcription elongation protein SprT n=1 Tax=Bradyrhizobium sp. BWC-3-1 TaxID=3080012 RepID=UPI00293E10C4|nr:transcription elongation protein SprT [Bradyrhizobium sp. BWC-3-1]WOH61958.1 transcription elongation protein SprT [Bradyrhizobium sp. BWC-3-1]